MKLKNFLFTCAGAVALLSTSVFVSSCTNDDAGDADGFTPIRPTMMTMDTGDVFSLGDSGTSDTITSTTYYKFSYTAEDSSDPFNGLSGMYTYDESSIDARTKSITLYYNATAANVTAGADFTNYTTRAIVVKFTSATQGYVVTDTGVESNDTKYVYATNTGIIFSN